jgi:hypothetical protein
MRSVGWLSLSHRCSWKDYPVPPPREWLLEARESRLRHSFLRCSWSPSTSSPISQYLSFVGGRRTRQGLTRPLGSLGRQGWWSSGRRCFLQMLLPLTPDSYSRSCTWSWLTPYTSIWISSFRVTTQELDDQRRPKVQNRKFRQLMKSRKVSRRSHPHGRGPAGAPQPHRASVYLTQPRLSRRTRCSNRRILAPKPTERLVCPDILL